MGGHAVVQSTIRRLRWVRLYHCGLRRKVGLVMLKPVPPSSVKRDDLVVITGTASSPYGVQYVDLRGVVATVEDDSFKVWPDADTGKWNTDVWFPFSGVESVAVVVSMDIKSGDDKGGAR